LNIEHHIAVKKNEVFAKLAEPGEHASRGAERVFIHEIIQMDSPARAIAEIVADYLRAVTCQKCDAQKSVANGEVDLALQ
jgi:hypothetical protein